MIDPIEMRRVFRPLMVAGALLGAALACTAPADPLPTATPAATSTGLPGAEAGLPGVEAGLPGVEASPFPTLPPTPTLPPDWASVAAGVELRAAPIPADGKSGAATAVLLRLDPSQITLTVRYDKAAPRPVLDWHNSLGALAVVNAGYFQEDYTSAGLIVAGGERSGLSFQGSEDYQEGMLSVVGGAVRIRSLVGQPYDPAEPLDEAVQGLPMLVEQGAATTFDLPDRPASRTAVALDGQGRLLLIHVGDGAITLTRLRDWLLGQSDLAVVTALNLDGGASTGMAVDGPYPVRDDSAARVPGVLVVMAQ